MFRTVLVFLVIVLAGANFALYHYGRATPDVAPVDGAAPTMPVERPAASPQPPAAARPEASSTTPGATRTPASAPAANRIGIASYDNAAALQVPVRGVTLAQLHDTYTDTRAQGRVHEAIDIMAPRGTPVLAVADGTVEKLFTSIPGGLTIYQFEPSGRYAYYYAHLDRYADGLAEKQTIRRGEVIGYVGSTGNADPAAPHLHFAIFELGPERQWWKGTAINPYPVLKGGR